MAIELLDIIYSDVCDLKQCKLDISISTLSYLLITLVGMTFCFKEYKFKCFEKFKKFKNEMKKQLRKGINNKETKHEKSP